MDIGQLLDGFDLRLGQLRQERLSVLQRANKGIALCRGTLAEMRVAVVSQGFANQQEEIHFFKEAKSIPMQHLVYYTEVHRCELWMPQLGQDAKLDFLAEERDRINQFYTLHLEFQRYLLEGRTERDALYFTRRHGGQHPIDPHYNYRYDTQFETSHDLLLASFKGLERYGNYLVDLEYRTRALHCEDGTMETDSETPFVFTWPDTAAVELAYAFREARAINHGDFEIRAFVDYFCKVFGIEIKEPYALLAQIASRKKHRAKYLQRILDAFLRFLDGRDA